MKIWPAMGEKGERGARERARTGGLTILEMLVSSAMLALIIVGLTAMFVQTQKAFKTGIKQTDVSDAGRSIADLMAADLAQLSDGTPYAVFDNVNSGLTNMMWGWDGGYPQNEDGHAFRTNLLEQVYWLVQTNTGWTGIGYAVSNMIPGLGVGTLYRYTSFTNAHFLDNHALFDPFLTAFHLNFPNTRPPVSTNNIHLDRIADGVVHLRVIPYDQYGNRMGYETNTSFAGIGEFYMGGPLTNCYPWVETVISVTPPIGRHYITNTLPYAVDLEIGILDPDAWDHLRGLAGNLTAQTNYLATSASKVEIFRKHVLVRAATNLQ